MNKKFAINLVLALAVAFPLIGQQQTPPQERTAGQEQQPPRKRRFLTNS